MIKSERIIELEKHLEHPSNVLEKLDLLFLLADEWFFLANKENCLFYANRLLELAKKEKNKRFELKASLMIANAYTLENKENEAFKLYSKIEIDAIQENDIDLLLNINTALANQYIRKGNFEKSIEYNQKNLKLAKEHSMPKNICRSNINLGVSYMNLQKFEKAKEYFMQAMKIAQDNKLKKITPLITHNLADLYRQQSDFDNALDYFFRTLTYYEELYDMEGLTLSLRSIAEIYGEIEQKDNAIDYALRAKDVAEELNSIRLLEETYYAVSVLYEKFKLYKEALLYHKKMVDITVKIFEGQLDECEKQIT